MGKRLSLHKTKFVIVSFVEDNAGGDNNWLWFDGVNSGYSSISRFEDFKDSYTKIHREK